MATVYTGVKNDGLWDWIQDSRGLSYMANGREIPQVWDGVSSATRNWGLPAMPAAVTFNAFAAGALTGDYYYYAVLYNSLTDVEGGQGPISAVMTAAAQNITVNRPSGATTADSQATHWRLYRNTAGQATVFYKVADVAIGTGTYADSNTDATISAAGNDTLNIENPKTRLNPQHPFVRHHNGYVIGWGGIIDSGAGAVTMTNGSANVTGVGTFFTKANEGMRFRIHGESTLYTVLTVTSATALTLSAVYAGTSSPPNKQYIIYPDNASLASWSIAGSFEEFRALYSVSVGSGDGGTPTGAFILLDALYLAKDNGLYRWAFTANPNPVSGDAAIFPVLKNRGLLNHRCCVVVGPYAYIMDRKGIYLFKGDYEEDRIDRQILPMLQPSYLAIAKRVNFSGSVTPKFHGTYDPKQDKVIFFVALDDDTEPYHAFVYDRRRNRWATEKRLSAVTASVLCRSLEGRDAAFISDEHGYVRGYGVNQGTDADTSFTVRGTVTSSTNTSLTDSTATFDDGAGPGGLVRHAGNWVEIYSGTGAGQERRITDSGSATTINVTPAWSVNPDATSKYRIGAVESIFETQNFAMPAPGTVPADKKEARFVRVYFEPRTSWTDSYIGVTLYKNWSATAFKDWSVQPKTDGLEIPSGAVGSTGDGEVRMYVDQEAGFVQVSLGSEYARAWRVKVRYKDAGRPVVITGVEIGGAVAPRNDWRAQ